MRLLPLTTQYRDNRLNEWSFEFPIKHNFGTAKCSDGKQHVHARGHGVGHARMCLSLCMERSHHRSSITIRSDVQTELFSHSPNSLTMSSGSFTRVYFRLFVYAQVCVWSVPCSTTIHSIGMCLSGDPTHESSNAHRTTNSPTILTTPRFVTNPFGKGPTSLHVRLHYTTKVMRRPYFIHINHSVE